MPWTTAAGTGMSSMRSRYRVLPRRWLVVSPARFDGGGHVAEHLARFRIIWPADAAERLQQVLAGPPQKALAARGGLGRRQPPRVPACGFPGLTGWRALRQWAGHLDDHELLQAVEAQRHLDEPELSRLDPVWPDLRLVKPT